MNVTFLPASSITAPAWNPNAMDAAMLARLRKSIELFGIVIPIVVREVAPGRYETVGGAQRLAVLRDLGYETVPCVVVDVDGAEARLLGQALNRIAGQDDPALRSEALRSVLARFTPEEINALLPDTGGMTGLSALGEDSLAEGLKSWQVAQASRLHHLGFHFTPSQLATVQAALAAADGVAPREGTNPNRRSTVLAHICRSFLASKGAGT